MPHKVAVIVGSLRKGSYNRLVAKAIAGLAPAELSFDFVEIGDLPLYNEDLEASGAPESWTRFRQQIKAADAVLFATPEYNRSVPAALKNALDVGSRPYGQSVYDGKPAGVVSVSVGAVGGFGANHHLRQSLVFLNMPVMQQPGVHRRGGRPVRRGGQAQERGHREVPAHLRRCLRGLDRQDCSQVSGLA